MSLYKSLSQQVVSSGLHWLLETANDVSQIEPIY